MIFYFSIGTLSKEAGLRQPVSVVLEARSKPACCWKGTGGLEFLVDILEKLLDLGGWDEEEGTRADMGWNKEVVS